MKVIKSVLAVFVAAVALQGCSTAQMQQDEAVRLARVEACQQAGGMYDWKNGVKQCLSGNTLAERHDVAIPVMVQVKHANMARRAR